MTLWGRTAYQKKITRQKMVAWASGEKWVGNNILGQGRKNPEHFEKMSTSRTRAGKGTEPCFRGLTGKKKISRE